MSLLSAYRDKTKGQYFERNVALDQFSHPAIYQEQDIESVISNFSIQVIWMEDIPGVIEGIANIITSPFATTKQIDSLYSLFTQHVTCTRSDEVIVFSKEQLGVIEKVVKSVTFLPFLHFFFQCYSSLYSTICPLLVHSGNYDAVLFAINECTDDAILSDNLRSLSMDAQDRLAILDSLFILLERQHSNPVLLSILSLLSDFPDGVVFSFLSKLPCNVDTLAWMIKQLSSMQWDKSSILILVMVSCCKWIDAMKLCRSFRLLGIVTDEMINNPLINMVIKKLEEISMTREIPFMDAFLLYFFHSNQPPSPSYFSLLRKFFTAEHVQLVYRLTEIASEEKLQWQFNEVFTAISAVRKLPSEVYILMLKHCSLDGLIDDLMVKWLMREGAAVVSYCMKESFSFSTLERLCLHLLEWSLTIPSSVISEDEERLMALMTQNPDGLLLILKDVIPITVISESHFCELLHLVIRLVESDRNYLPLVFLTAHDYRFHSSLLIQTCHSLVEECSEFQDQSLFEFFRNVSIAAVFMLLMGIRGRKAISMLFVAMVAESGITDKGVIVDVKSLLLPQPVLTDLFQHSQHPLVLLYLLEFLELSNMDLSAFTKIIIDTLAHPLESIDFSKLSEQNETVLEDLKELYSVVCSKRRFSTLHQLDVLNLLLKRLIAEHPEAISAESLNLILFPLLASGAPGTQAFVNCIRQEQEREESLEEWKVKPLHSPYWSFFTEYAESSTIQSYTKMLIRCAPLSDCRELLQLAMNNSLPGLNESDCLRIIAEIITLPLSLMDKNVDETVLREVTDAVEVLCNGSYLYPLPSFLSFCESLNVTYYQDLSNLLIHIFQLTTQDGVSIKLSKRIKAGLRRIAQRMKTKEELTSSEEQFIGLFDWSTSHSSRKKLPKRLFNRNPVINNLLQEEAGSDNYDDLADFIDPSPDLSVREIQRFIK